LRYFTTKIPISVFENIKQVERRANLLVEFCTRISAQISYKSFAQFSYISIFEHRRQVLRRAGFLEEFLKFAQVFPHKSAIRVSHNFDIFQYSRIYDRLQERHAGFLVEFLKFAPVFPHKSAIRISHNLDIFLYSRIEDRLQKRRAGFLVEFLTCQLQGGKEA